MTKKAFAAKMNLYDEKYGEFAVLFCKLPPEEYGNVIEYFNLLQALENDHPGILSAPLEEEKNESTNDEYKELVKAYMEIPDSQRTEALKMLRMVDTMIAEKETT